MRGYASFLFYAGLTELVDVTDLKSVVSFGVWVQIPYPAPKKEKAIKGKIKKAVKPWEGRINMKVTLSRS